MKLRILLIVTIAFVTAGFAAAQNSPDTSAITYELTYKDNKYVVHQGDSVHLGYGSTPYGSFMYLEIGADGEGISKEYATRVAVVTKITYYKMNNKYRIYLKTIDKPVSRFFTDNFLPAVGKQEIVGINSIKF